ncbi:MAG: hypothetical protein HY079_00730 [Elusimicrobia bacterium]|nr:hypothetical protein [Elusimicrobiota bacterium]
MNKRLFLISFHLSAPEKNAKYFAKGIKSYKVWARVGHSAFLVFTADDPNAIRDKMSIALEPEDKLFVAAVESPSAWTGFPDSTTNWLQKYFSVNPKI